MPPDFAGALGATDGAGFGEGFGAEYDCDGRLTELERLALLPPLRPMLAASATEAIRTLDTTSAEKSLFTFIRFPL